MGLGLHGGAAAVVKWLLKKQALLTVTDLKNAKELKMSLDKLKQAPHSSTIKYTLGQHKMDDFIKQDLIIQNPGVPANSQYLTKARSLGIPIINEAVLFFGLYLGKVIGVTGTRGKSTTSTLIHHILKTKIKNNVIAGNIATNPMLNVLDKLSLWSWPVLELSSWHLEGLRDYKISPQIAVVTNVLNDHLNRYKNFNEYKNSKQAIVQHQKKGDYVVLNADNKFTKQFSKKAKAKVYFFSLKSKIRGSYLADGWVYFFDKKRKEKIMPVDDVKLLGQHNLANVLAAVTVAKLVGISNHNIKRAVGRFHGLEYRLQYKGHLKNLAVFNDATSTTPDATLAALNAFKKSSVILIAGGEDKKLDYYQLAKQIKKKVSKLFLLSGSASQKLIKELKKVEYPSQKMIININTLEKAWSLALKSAGSYDQCLLFSPAAASFNMFVNEFERARLFDKLFYDQKKKK